MDCRECQTRREGRSLFSCLGRADLVELEGHRIARTYLAGQVLFLQSDPMQGIYCLQSGLVKLESTSPNGDCRLLRLARSGEPLGYRAFLTRRRQRFGATALTRVQVCFIPVRRFPHDVLRTVVETTLYLSMPRSRRKTASS